MNEETLGQRIKRLRQAAGLSQAALAEACGWKSQSRVGNYEKDSREPTLADLALIASAVRVDVCDLILDSGAAPLQPIANVVGTHAALTDLQQALLAATEGLDYGQMAELIACAKQMGGGRNHGAMRQLQPDRLDKPVAALLPESAVAGQAERANQLDQAGRYDDRRKQDHGPPDGVERRAKL